VDSVAAFPEAKVGPFGAVTIREPESPQEAAALHEMEDMGDMRRLLDKKYVQEIVDQKTLRDFLLRFLKREMEKQAPLSNPKGVLCI
jgi:hypothetical protein